MSREGSNSGSQARLRKQVGGSSSVEQGNRESSVELIEAHPPIGLESVRLNSNNGRHLKAIKSTNSSMPPQLAQVSPTSVPKRSLRRQNKSKSYYVSALALATPTSRRERNNDNFPVARMTSGRASGSRSAGNLKSALLNAEVLSESSDGSSFSEDDEGGSRYLSVNVNSFGHHGRQSLRGARKMAAEVSADASAVIFDDSDHLEYIDDIDDIGDNNEEMLSLNIIDHANSMERSPSPSAELVEALEALSLTSYRLQKSHTLPLLLRNLRVAFEARCRKIKAPTTLSESLYGTPTLVQVFYKLGDDDEFVGRMTEWMCPLCQLFKHFMTREMLDVHLSLYHNECTYSWDMIDKERPRLNVIVPEPDELDSDDAISSTSEEESIEYLLSPSSLHTSLSPALLSSYIYQKDQNTDPLERPSTPAPRLPALPEEVPFVRAPSVKPEKESPAPESPRLAAPKPVRRPERPIDLTNPYRYPTPPPYDNFEGPSAVYPFIGPDKYSARPGGPKIYDLLDDLPVEQFGVMTWFMLDKEEEIFEVDNVRDEDKVMQALWARWIIVNRNEFIKDYNVGTRRFIDEYWRMIHRAAGFSALRVWLLVLVGNRFLTGTQFCLLLKYYSELVGMDLWV